MKMSFNSKKYCIILVEHNTIDSDIYRKMIINLPHPVMLHTSTGEIILVNSAWEDLTGYKFSEISEIHEWLERIFDETRELDKDIIPEDDGINEILKIKTKYGKILEWRFRSLLIDDNKNIYMSTAQNVKYENELQELNEELKRSNEDLEQFAYVASHDLQEPLRVIHGFVELLEKDFKDHIDEDGKYMFGAIKKATVRMQRLIDDLLKFSRLGKNDYNEQVDLNEIILLIKENLDVVLKEKNVEIIADKLPVIRGNYTELGQLFQNLISNAIKFNQNQPQIKVQYELIDNTHYLKFSDNGIGIEKKYRDDVFIIFKRLHSKKNYSGTGLGLALCKKIVDQLEGDIWVTDSENGGSTFHIQFPVKVNLVE